MHFIHDCRYSCIFNRKSVAYNGMYEVMKLWQALPTKIRLLQELGYRHNFSNVRYLEECQNEKERNGAFAKPTTQKYNLRHRSRSNFCRHNEEYVYGLMTFFTHSILIGIWLQNRFIQNIYFVIQSIDTYLLPFHQNVNSLNSVLGYVSLHITQDSPVQRRNWTHTQKKDIY